MESVYHFEVETLSDLPIVALEILQLIKKGESKIVALDGKMGAGKTTLIVQLLKQMNVEEDSSSPTFSIVNEHYSKEYGKIFHCDFYRLKNEHEAYDIGIEEIIHGNNWCFIEWPSQLGNLLPDSVVRIKIQDLEGRRLIDVEL